MPLSYRMERGPGIKDGFTREKRGRVSLHLVVMLRRRGKEEVRAGGKSGLGDGEKKEQKREREERESERGQRRRERKAVQREGERDADQVIMLRSSTVSRR